MNLLIIIPAYNEAENISKVVDNLIHNYPKWDYIVVNDGSKDNTYDICKDNHYHCLNLPVNIGLAGAVQAGMKYAAINNYDAAIQFDGDGQHDPQYIETLCRTMEEQKADIVIGSRFKDIPCKRSMRMLGSRIIKFLIRLTTGKTITDPTSGMRLFSRSLIRECAWNMNYRPEPDTLAYLIKRGAKIVEVQVEMNDRLAGESYLNPTRAIKYMIDVCISILFIQWFRKKEKIV